MKQLFFYEIASLIFLAVTLYLTMGSLEGQSLDIIAMYALFMFGTMGYIKPLFDREQRRRKEDSER